MDKLIIFLLGVFIILILLALCGSFLALVLMLAEAILELFKDVRNKWKKL